MKFKLLVELKKALKSGNIEAINTTSTNIQKWIKTNPQDKSMLDKHSRRYISEN